MINVLYKCRLCGETFSPLHKPDILPLAEFYIMDILRGEDPEKILVNDENRFPVHHIHKCTNKQDGIGDIAGFSWE